MESWEQDRLFGPAALRGGWSAACGARVGHSGVAGAPTGCTVVLFERACAYAAEATGGAASSRQVSALLRDHSVTVADAVLVTGGSAFGLDAGGGAMRWLEERGRGIAVGSMRVPAVPTVTVFDLAFGKKGAWPGVETGYAACEAAGTVVAEGRVGAGSGTAVGKVLGPGLAMWGGVGAAHVEIGTLVVGAIAVVNAFGNVHDPGTGRCVAGARNPAGGFADAEEVILTGALGGRLRAVDATTVGVVVTNGRLKPVECRRAAILASQAFPACIRPCQTAVDGDTVLLASAGEVEADSHQVGIAARLALSRAIVRAVGIANGGGAEPPVLRAE
ncbi:MAG: P1 family peptidase [Deltaproteobacteria bacterium]|nr:P1 family peptidase [Deltaproteobacteria bacterium]